MTTTKSTPALPTRKPIPPLENGDHLTRDEFERRYEAMPAHIKAELVEGVVYMSSPVSRRHGRPHVLLAAWIGLYMAQTPGVDAGDNTTVQLDLDNEVQPDIYLRIEQSHGGPSRVSEQDYVVGAPEWAGEVTATSVSYDLHNKLRAYERNGVREYLVWRVEDQAIDWFFLNQHRYERLPVTDGVAKSHVFPGLWLDATAMVQRDLPRVLAVLQRGLASPEHAAFVPQLESAAKSTKK